MESSAHDVVVVARQHGQARSRLPIPDADGLVVGRAHLNTKGKEKGKNKKQEVSVPASVLRGHAPVAFFNFQARSQRYSQSMGTRCGTAQSECNPDARGG